MEYTIGKLSKLSGVSKRALRYYEELGLISPSRLDSNGYRLYGKKEIERLQHILFYKELGVSLEDIYNILIDENFNRETLLKEHLKSLILKKEQINLLILNIEKTILETKGGTTMKDEEKFIGFKETLIKENRENYGEELRKKYDPNFIEKSNIKVRNMNESSYKKAEELSNELNKTLGDAYKTGDVASELAQKSCALHKEWLLCFWDKSYYSKESHLALAKMYLEDERFKKYYDKIAEECAEFLVKALNIYLE